MGWVTADHPTIDELDTCASNAVFAYPPAPLSV